LTYTLTVSDTNFGNNNNPDPVSGLTVKDTLPSGFTPTGNWTCSAGTGSSCPTGDPLGNGNLSRDVNLGVGSGATVVFTIVGTADSLGTLTNNASLDVPPTFNAVNSTLSSSTNTTVNRTGDLAIAKVVTSPNPPSVSRSGNSAARAVRYTVTVTNSAGADAALGATFNEANNGSLTFGAWTCSASTGSSCGTASGNGRPNGLAISVAAGGVLTYTINATVNTSASLGTLVNTVTVTAPNGFVDSNTNNNSASANVTVRT
jgi:hypothetical protein